MSTATVNGATGLPAEIEALGPWFHNLHLPDGTQTAPQHFLGDFPSYKWRQIAPCIPEDLTGWTVLDIGCNAGFYSFQLAARGARVTGIDVDPRYLRQAEWAARQFGFGDRVTFRQMQVYDVAHIDEQFDLVWFMGVFYHLRHPLLALDIVARHTKRMLMFQTMTLPGSEELTPPENFTLDDRQMMRDLGWPMMAFIEHKLADDPTNWWAANHACVVAMLRSSGFRVIARPAHELYLCEPHDSDPYGLRQLLDDEYNAATGRARREAPAP